MCSLCVEDPSMTRIGLVFVTNAALEDDRHRRVALAPNCCFLSNFLCNFKFVYNALGAYHCKCLQIRSHHGDLEPWSLGNDGKYRDTTTRIRE
jgi:hypothetical protein